MKLPFYKKDNFSLFISEWEERVGIYEFKHSLLFPKNTYSPWLEEGFIKYFNDEIKDFTLKDIYRCYELNQLANQMMSLKGSVIEIGVWRGGSAKILEKNLGEGNKLYLCDTFNGVVKAGIKDKTYKGGEHSDTSFEEVSKIFNHNSSVKILQGIFPEQTAHLIDDEPFKLCHIDVDVYESAKDIFEWIYPKLIIGGVVVFDDYGFAACEGVTSYVNSLIGNLDFRAIYNLNGHAVLIKIA